MHTHPQVPAHQSLFQFAFVCRREKNAPIDTFLCCSLLVCAFATCVNFLLIFRSIVCTLFPMFMISSNKVPIRSGHVNWNQSLSKWSYKWNNPHHCFIAELKSKISHVSSQCEQQISRFAAIVRSRVRVYLSASVVCLHFCFRSCVRFPFELITVNDMCGNVMCVVSRVLRFNRSHSEMGPNHARQKKTRQQ